MGFLWSAAFLRQKLGCTVLSWGWINHIFFCTLRALIPWLVPSVFHLPSFSSCTFTNTEVFIICIYLSIYDIHVCVYIYLKNTAGFTLNSTRGKPVLCSASACWDCPGLDCCKAITDGRTASTMRLSLTLKNICHPQAIIN